MKHNILGVQANFFDLDATTNETSASYVSNGELRSAIAQERISRKKLDGRFPHEAIQEVLRLEGIDIKDVDALAVPFLHPAETNRRYLQSALTTWKDTGVYLNQKVKDFSWNYTYNKLKTAKSFQHTINGKEFTLEHCDHHTAHAAGAYYCSPFDKALVITLDGGGDGLDGSAYVGEGTKLTKLFEIPHFQSPGTMYSAVTNDLGFKRHRHEGKITGLAAYGNDDLERLGLQDLLHYDSKKHRFISKGVAGQHKDLHGKSSYFYPLLEKFTREDLAAAAQKILETEVLKYAKDALAVAKSKGYDLDKVCMAGGVFANVKMNQRILDIEGINNVFIYPAMGDDGLSGGAALWLYYQQPEVTDKSASVINHTYRGGAFTNDEIKAALDKAGLEYTFHEEVEVEIAKLLNESKVVGRFNGAMEYGPRALGNRSIIGAPFDPTINDWLNKRLNRTEFMPFAPSITEEHAEDYFVGYKQEHIAADFMTITYDVIKDKAEKMPAVVHVDNTARPQVVRKATNPSYHKIIDEFYKLSGVPVVLNTSFNIHEQPIVYKPEDAIAGYLEGKLDVLAIGNFIVK